VGAALSTDSERALVAIVVRNTDAIREFLKSDAAARHTLVGGLMDRGLLQEVRIDQFPAEVAAEIRRSAEAGGGSVVARMAEKVRAAVPEATSVLISKGRLFVATASQTPKTADPVEFRVFLQGSFLNECLALFVECGMIDAGAAAECVTAFERLAK